MTVYGDEKKIRSFQYDSNLVEGLMWLMEGKYVGSFNLGNPSEFTMLELAQFKACIVTTENDQVHNEIVDLLKEYGVQKLVMGAVLKKQGSKTFQPGPQFCSKKGGSHCILLVFEWLWKQTEGGKIPIIRLQFTQTVACLKLTVTVLQQLSNTTRRNTNTLIKDYNILRPSAIKSLAVIER
nr:UDP-glucuronic acid decarboxylase 4 [Tanacetum cinerariifolium]